MSLDITFGKIFAHMRLAYLGHCILKLTKNGTDVHEEETASATDNKSTLRTETNSVSETLVYLNYRCGCGPERILQMTTGLGAETLHLTLLINDKVHPFTGTEALYSPYGP
jgi:hypothetical protein